MVIWKNFFRGTAGTTPSIAYVHNTAQYPSVAIRSINISNSSESGVVVKVWIVPLGQTLSDPYLIIPGWYLPPKNPKTGDCSSSQWTGFEVMSTSGDVIYMEASVPGVISIAINGGASK